jgi:glutathione S-transferase
MSERQLYFISGSPPCWSVMLALEIKGLPYEPKRLNNSKGEQKALEFLRINPRGHVPTLIEGDITVSETHAVLAYLDAAHPAPALFGKSPQETARIWQRISEIESHLRDQVGDISRPLFRGKSAEFSEQISSAAAKVRGELELLEAGLENTPFIATGTLSVADLITYPVIMQLGRAADRKAAKSFNLPHPLMAHYPKLAAWAQRIEALPGSENAYPPHWK